MKQFISITLFILNTWLCGIVHAQVQLSLTIPNLGSPYLSDYISDESNRVLIITNTTGQEQSVFLRGKIEQLNSPGYYFRTEEDFKPLAPIILSPFETRTLFARAEDWAFMTTDHLEDNVPAAEKRRIEATGILPEGEYQICLQAFDFHSEQPLSSDEPGGCQFFLVSLGSPPQIVVPLCGDSIDQEYPLVSWTPAIIMQAIPDIVYDLYVVELVSPALNPAEVMEQSILYRGGNPFVVENLRQTFYQFLPGDPPLNEDSRYAICIVARSERGSAMFENDGRSEICIVDTRSASAFPPAIGIIGGNVASSQPDPETFQLPPVGHLQGRLLYRFYEDQTGTIHSEHLQDFLGMMQLQPGQSLQNQGYQSGGNSAQQPMQFGNLTPAVFNNSSYQQPPPPQYLLPAGYNLTGGKPLKQARIRFTARYAVGNKINIEHPEDLTLIAGGVDPIHVTGANVPDMLVFESAEKVIAATSTDTDGNYNVSFFADETFGVLATGPVDVEWGGGEFPESASGYGFFRVITMEVEEKWYCHPDIIIILQPGQSLDVPTQVVTVQSYNLKVKVRANQDALQYAGPGGPIRDAVVKIGRSKYLHDQYPACFPKDEIKIDEYGQLLIGTPLKAYMTGDTGMTDINGNMMFRRLVRHDGMGGCGELFENDDWPSDGYYLEAYSHPTQGDLNYARKDIRQLAPCGARLSPFCSANNCAPRSAQYVPPLVEQEITLAPQFPKILANSRSLYNNVPYPLGDVTLILLVNHENGDFRLKPYKTDAEGLFMKQFMSADNPELMRTTSNGEITSNYIMDYFKSGYKRSFCNDCGTTDNPKYLQFGQKWFIEPHLDPGSYVKGVVEDEHGQPIHGDFKIGDGPYLPLEMRWKFVNDTDPADPGLPFSLDDLGVSPQDGLQTQGNLGQLQQIGGAVLGNPGLPEETLSQNGFTIEIQNTSPVLSPDFEQVSVFQQAAQSGQQIPLIIRPDGSNYFADTFYVNIPANYAAPGYDLGTFVIKEKLHRPRIIVSQHVLGIGNDQLPELHTAPLEGAEVTLSNLPSQSTDATGVVNYVFGSPANEFRLRINKNGFIPYDQYITIPASKDPYIIEVTLEYGKTLTGTVTRADGGEPVEGARVYTEIGSNNYGPIVLETFSNSSGQYTLDGLPAGVLTVEVTKSDSSITYIGQSKTVSTGSTSTLDFQLVEAPFFLSQIWNLPVAIESVTPSGNNWIVSGAFVDIPHNARFHPEDETQRLAFDNIAVKVTGTGPNGKPLAEPVGTSILTNSLKFRSILNDVHIVVMSGPHAPNGIYYVYSDQYSPIYINRIRVDKETGNGHIKARTFSLLEYFRTTYNYDGQFYLGETPESALISAYKGTEDLTMPESYYLTGYDHTQNQVINPEFVVHNFNAFTDRQESYVHQDSFVLATKLIVDLPLSNPDQLIVSTGAVIVLPDKIVVNEGDEPLEFDLETWHVKTGNWHFDQYQGGLVTSGIITTTLIEFPAPYMLIKPTDIKLPLANEIDLDQITLAGVLDLAMQPGAKLTFDYINSPLHDPAQGHWRIVLSDDQQGQAVSMIEGLPGWPAQTEVDIYFIENFSDGFQQLTLAPNQVVNHYNVIEQTVSNIFVSEGGVALSGNTNLGIPNLPNGYSAAFVYYKEQGQTKLRVQGLFTTFESTGQVKFQGDQQHERIFLDWNHFEVTGGLSIYDDQSPNEIHLRGKLIKKPNDIRIKIILVDNGGELEGNNEQFIYLGGGQNGVKRVLQGEQLVEQTSWGDLVYQARFEGFGDGFQQGGDVMWFRVVGSLINDPTKDDEVKLANIETPFGDFSLTMVFSEMAIVGNLNVANIPMGAVTILEGAINMRMGGLGFYLASHLRAIYPFIGELNTNFIVGSYPHIAPDAQEILKAGMYIQALPDFLVQSGIQGLYICANKPIFEVNWEVDLVVFGIGVYAEAGFDARFWLNFGQSYGAAHLGGLAYAGFEMYVNVLGVCDLCVGLLAELGFEAEYQWTPSTSFDISACGTVGFNVDFCGTGFNDTAKLEVGWSSSSNDVYYEAVLGESCSGNAEQNNSGCSHF